MWTADRALTVIAKYNRHVNRPNYGPRKRGNPQPVIEAVSFLLNGKHCARCGGLDKPQLHHINGEWRDYQIANLQFYCHSCHLDDHHGNWQIKPNGVHSRMNKRMVWNDTNATKLSKLITEHPSNTITAACVDISENSMEHFGQKFTATSLSKAYYSLKRQGKVANTGRSVTTSVPSNRTLTFEQAFEFYDFVKRAGITIR